MKKSIDVEEVEMAVNFAVNSNNEIIALHEITELVAGHKDISNIAKSLLCANIMDVSNQVARGIGFCLRMSHNGKEIIAKIPRKRLRKLIKSGYRFQYKPKKEWLNVYELKSFDEGFLIRIIDPDDRPYMLVEGAVEYRFVKYENDHMVIKPQFRR